MICSASLPGFSSAHRPSPTPNCWPVEMGAPGTRGRRGSGAEGCAARSARGALLSSRLFQSRRTAPGFPGSRAQAPRRQSCSFGAGALPVRESPLQPGRRSARLRNCWTSRRLFSGDRGAARGTFARTPGFFVAPEPGPRPPYYQPAAHPLPPLPPAN